MSDNNPNPPVEGGAYEGGAIQVLSDRDIVRTRPGMYLGALDKDGLHHLVWEILDNALDEALNGHATVVTVALSPDGKTVSVKDNGRGIPVDYNPLHKTTALELVFTKFHSGAKFDKSSYASAGGLHGVGAAVAQFLSREMVVTVLREGKAHQARFEDGFSVQPPRLLDTKPAPGERGTEVRFTPLYELFQDTGDRFDEERLRDRLQLKAWLIPGLTVVFLPQGEGGPAEQYAGRGGLKTLWAKRLEPPQASLMSPAGEPLLLTVQCPEGDLQLVTQWARPDEDDPDADNIAYESLSFVNLIPTSGGGSHVDGVLAGLRAGLTSAHEILNGGAKPDWAADDWKAGHRMLINLKWRGELLFTSNLKQQIAHKDMASQLTLATRKAVESWATQNPNAAASVLEHFRQVKAARDKLKELKADAKAGKAAPRLRADAAWSERKRTILPGKLSECATHRLEDRELYLVEGDSAESNAKQARDRATQAILPLRGKVLNSESASDAQISKNKELQSLLEAVGPDDAPRYGKIILLMDADSDGHHIATLLLTFFLRHRPLILKAGRVYLGMPPLYRVQHAGKNHWAADEEELDAAMKATGGKGEISRFKGLGEMPPGELKSTVMSPLTRRLCRVVLNTPQEEVLADQLVRDLMGKRADVRSELVLEAVNNGEAAGLATDDGE
jgi:DNA gyrase subunit B